MANSIIRRYISKITGNIDDDFARQRQIFSIYMPFGAVLHILYLVFFVIVDVKVMAFFNIGSVISWIIGTLLLKKYYRQSAVIIVSEVTLHVLFCIHFIGWGFGIQFFLLLIPITIIVAFRSKILIIISGVLSLAGFIVLYLYSQSHAVGWIANKSIMNIAYSFNIVIGISMVSFVVVYYKLLAENAERKVDEANKKLTESNDKLIKSNSKLDNITGSLKKYLPLQLVKSIVTGEKKVDISSERKKLTIFFSDIQGFTEITDTMEPEELSSMLNEYITEMTKIAHKWEGTIDKFVGDAMMVLFGTSESANVNGDAVKCVRMAMEMQDKMKVLKDKWFRSGIDTPLEIRIGINTGITAVGNFGTEDRLSYTAIGGQVNLASRLEGLAEPGGILISHSTWGLINNEIDCKPRENRVEVKGINRKILVYDVVMSA